MPIEIKNLLAMKELVQGIRDTVKSAKKTNDVTLRRETVLTICESYLDLLEWCDEETARIKTEMVTSMNQGVAAGVKDHLENHAQILQDAIQKAIWESVPSDAIRNGVRDYFATGVNYQDVLNAIRDGARQR